MAAYYNEHDAQKAAWLRELIRRNVIADGEVDERDIRTVQPEEIRGFAQCHFFAGVGVWSYALRLAGWPDDRECWTGSCPCPSFSAAGQGKGFDDARHLWPDWVRLIRVGKPAVIFGEQADDAIGYGWLDLVQTDLEAEAYAVGKAVLGACSVGGSDIRQRLYWMAHAGCTDRARRVTFRPERCDSQGRERELSATGIGSSADESCPECGHLWSVHCDIMWRASGCQADGCNCDETGRLEHSERARLEGHAGNGDDGHESRWFGADAARSTSQTGTASRLADFSSMRAERLSEEGQAHISDAIGSGKTGGLADSDGGQSWHGTVQRSGEHGQLPQDSGARVQHPAADALKGFWRNADWLLCTDGFWRPVEAGTFPLAHGAPCRLGRLRGYGDAINAEVAKVFIEESYAAQIETETAINKELGN